MRITNQLNNQKIQKQNFTSVNLIQVSRSAKEFKGLNPKQVENLFKSRVARITRGLPGFAVNALQRTGLISRKAEVYLETPLYTDILLARSKLKRLDNVPILSPGISLDKNYHSFYVYTQDQALAYQSIVDSDPREVQLVREEVREKLAPESWSIWLREIRRLRQEMAVAFYEKVAPILDKKIVGIHKGQAVHAFRINTLAELPEVFNKIDY